MTKKFVLLTLATAIFSTQLHAEVSCRDIPVLKAPQGQEVNFKGNLLRYEQKCWYLPLKSGQRLHINLKDNNGNSALTIYKPGATIKYGSGNPQDEDPANYYYGDTLKGAPADGETRKVNETVTDSGKYLMVVGLSAGAGSEFSGTLKAR
ncbi:hypothetical protein [Erwinia phyllosphaerae]|uniref:hypothetical protein n=1 Tax=Erwinia phyllosphaerae TaxID=2853256 RepID=UPI001FF0489A|nr:hypothetical protein [Erwinia phyllosphaerae]MBV4366268.1 hypothetical protein [Erwinia phyllosphaerae]